MSFSFRFHVTRASQTWLLSSFQLTPSLLMMRPVGGGAGRPGARGGLKLDPLFGGGLRPPYGPAGLDTIDAGKIIERLPDSKIATNTRVPSLASARGFLPWMGTVVG